MATTVTDTTLDNMKRKENFDAEEFINSLLNEGSKIACDETNNSFKQFELPSYYDEILFKRGQQFFHNNIFPLLFGKILGLLSILAIPSILKILMFTKMSSSEFTVYKRYRSTLLHMYIWYQEDIGDSKSSLWRSIKEIRNRHNSASKRSCCASSSLHQQRISQKDMALTQFGFMGYAVTRSKMIGLHHQEVHNEEEDWKAFIHVWRVIGYLMGIEDRFNICRDNVEDTRHICRLLIDKEFRPNFKKKDKNFLEMARYFADGIWVISPMVNYRAYMTYLHDLLQPIGHNNNNNNNNNNHSCKQTKYMELSWKDSFFYYLIYIVMWSVQFSVFRFYFNSVELIAMWLRSHFPFLAYMKYGYNNSQVTILPSNSRNNVLKVK